MIGSVFGHIAIPFLSQQNIFWWLLRWLKGKNRGQETNACNMFQEKPLRTEICLTCTRRTMTFGSLTYMYFVSNSILKWELKRSTCFKGAPQGWVFGNIAKYFFFSRIFHILQWIMTVARRRRCRNSGKHMLIAKKKHTANNNNSNNKAHSREAQTKTEFPRGTLWVTDLPQAQNPA